MSPEAGQPLVPVQELHFREIREFPQKPPTDGAQDWAAEADPAARAAPRQAGAGPAAAPSHNSARPVRVRQPALPRPARRLPPIPSHAPSQLQGQPPGLADQPRRRQCSVFDSQAPSPQARKEGPEEANDC
jgi:hypothetical protein